MIDSSRSARSSEVVDDHASNAARAAATARSTSLDPPSAMRPNGVSVAGLITSMTFGSSGFCQVPSMKQLKWSRIGPVCCVGR